MYSNNTYKSNSLVPYGSGRNMRDVNQYNNVGTGMGVNYEQNPNPSGIPDINVAMKPLTRVNRVTPGQMRNELNKRANRNIDMGNKLLNRCYRSIHTVGVNLRERFCVFDIPVMELEMKGCDKNKIIMYLCHDLTKNGYQVEFFQPNKLLIRWNLSQKSIDGGAGSVGNGVGRGLGAPPPYRQLTYNNYRNINEFQRHTPGTQFNSSGGQQHNIRHSNPYHPGPSNVPRLPENKSDFPLMF